MTKPADTPAFPEVMNQKQAAAFCQLNIHAMAALLRSGVIPCRRLNERTIRVTKRALLAYMEGLEAPQ